MPDNFSNQVSSLDSPARNAAEITPNDSTDLSNTTRAIYVGTAGNLKVTMAGGEAVTYKNVAPGYHPIRVTRIWSTGTTAADIVAIY